MSQGFMKERRAPSNLPIPVHQKQFGNSPGLTMIAKYRKSWLACCTWLNWTSEHHQFTIELRTKKFLRSMWFLTFAI